MLTITSEFQFHLNPLAGGAGAWVALSHCPFYPEGGGQVADTGHVTFLHEGQHMRAIVKDCKKVGHANARATIGTLIWFENQISDSCVVISVTNPLPSVLLSDVLSVASVVTAEVDANKRR
jgi:Ser-tRNA(Ala) deacylase AlaX